MSSHHFVKEGQEPALLIIDALSLEMAEPLLEWAPLVMVSDTVLINVLSWGIKVDVALVRENQTEEMKMLLIDQIPVEIITYNDQTNLLSAAFNFLLNREQKAVNVMAVTSDLFFNDINRFVQNIQIDVFGQGIRWVCISSGRYEKWLPAMSRIKIMINGGEDIKSTGLKDHQEYWEVEKDGMVLLHSKGLFWVGEFH